MCSVTRQSIQLNNAAIEKDYYITQVTICNLLKLDHSHSLIRKNLLCL